MGEVAWADIPQDILLSIAGRLHTAIDYLNVAQVCKPWRSTTLSPHNILIPSQPPFLMLAESMKEEQLRGFAEFNPKNEGTKIYNLCLPQLYQNRCIGSTGNWLILINLDLQIYILNPFTKKQIQLPSQSTLPYQFDYDDDDPDKQEDLRNLFVKKAFLSSSDSEGDIVAMVIFSPWRRVAFARPGDSSWTPFPSETVPEVDDVYFFRGQFCTVNQKGNVMACHIDSSPPKAVQLTVGFIDLHQVNRYYLVEWLDKLVSVIRYYTNYDEAPFYKTERFELFKYHFDTNEWSEILNLGYRSLFLGFNTSVSLLTLDDSPFRKNCIYFTDNNTRGYFGNESEGGHDMGVFDLEEGTIKPHYNGVSTSFYSPPLWIIPKSISESAYSVSYDQV